MLVALVRDLWRLGRVPARHVLTRGRHTMTLGTIRFGVAELERHLTIRKNLDWFTYRGGNLTAFEVETEGLKLSNESSTRGDFAKIESVNFCHVLASSEAEVENFSLDDISLSESIIVSSGEDRVLIPDRMVNMLGFINERLEKISPVLSEKQSAD